MADLLQPINYQFGGSVAKRRTQRPKFRPFILWRPSNQDSLPLMNDFNWSPNLLAVADENDSPFITREACFLYFFHLTTWNGIVHIKHVKCFLRTAVLSTSNWLAGHLFGSTNPCWFPLSTWNFQIQSEISVTPRTRYVVIAFYLYNYLIFKHHNLECLALMLVDCHTRNGITL